jgi:hypothetical protein
MEGVEGEDKREEAVNGQKESCARARDSDCESGHLLDVDHQSAGDLLLKILGLPVPPA